VFNYLIFLEMEQYKEKVVNLYVWLEACKVECEKTRLESEALKRQIKNLKNQVKLLEQKLEWGVFEQLEDYLANIKTDSVGCQTECLKQEIEIQTENIQNDVSCQTDIIQNDVSCQTDKVLNKRLKIDIKFEVPTGNLPKPLGRKKRKWWWFLSCWEKFEEDENIYQMPN
jgi:hypothetical protein